MEQNINETNTIGKDYNLFGLFKFALPPMLTQLLISLLQTIDDGLFISRYIGKNALAAFAICMPIFHLFEGASSLFGASNILCSSKMGEKKNEEANEIFTTITLIAALFGIITAILIRVFIKPILSILGATSLLLPYCLDFFSIYVLYLPFMMINGQFSRFYTTSGKPKLSMISSVGSMIINVLCDYILIVKLHMGIKGVAYSNLFGFIYSLTVGFTHYCSKKSEIRLTKLHKDKLKILFETCKLGLPLTFTFVAICINSVLTNHILLSIVDETAIAAKSIVNSIQFMFMSAYFGIFTVCCPMISYQYGAKDKEKLRKIIRQTYELNVLVTVIIIGLYIIGLEPVKSLYLIDNKDIEINTMVDYGLRISPYAFLFFALVVGSEDIFISIQEPKTSAIISAFENIIFANLTIIVLPLLFGIKGYWFNFLVCEGLSSIVAFYYIYKYRDILGLDFKKKRKSTS